MQGTPSTNIWPVDNFVSCLTLKYNAEVACFCRVTYHNISGLSKSIFITTEVVLCIKKDVKHLLKTFYET